jgi:hypothetical protein
MQPFVLNSNSCHIVGPAAHHVGTSTLIYDIIHILKDLQGHEYSEDGLPQLASPFSLSPVQWALTWASGGVMRDAEELMDDQSVPAPHLMPPLFAPFYVIFGHNTMTRTDTYDRYRYPQGLVNGERDSSIKRGTTLGDHKECFCNCTCATEELHSFMA